MHVQRSKLMKERDMSRLRSSTTEIVKNGLGGSVSNFSFLNCVVDGFNVISSSEM